MRRSNLAVRVALLIVSIVASTALVQAQYRTSIQGVVTDPTGAVVSGATLTLTNPATGEKQVRTSDAAGVFNFNALAAAANFRLEVEKTGFEKKVLDHVNLIPDQANALNVSTRHRLCIADRQRGCHVAARAGYRNRFHQRRRLRQPDSASCRPSAATSSNLRNWLPGMFADGSQGGGGGAIQPSRHTEWRRRLRVERLESSRLKTLSRVIANGNQTQNTGISIDGISTTSAVWGGATVITPSEDSVGRRKSCHQQL